MTNGDKIRAMSDEKLAELFAGLLSAERGRLIQKLRESGIAAGIEVIEVPMLAKAAHLEWLRAEADGPFIC